MELVPIITKLSRRVTVAEALLRWGNQRIRVIMCDYARLLIPPRRANIMVLSMQSVVGSIL